MAKRNPENSGLEPVLLSFPPVSAPDARILLLGSMPGKASLDANQYYAHPRNLFWPIMGELYGASPALPYGQRLEILLASGIALWDVIDTCRRRSSLDSDIREETPAPLDTFLNDHPQITLIGFNGKKAEASYRRHFPALAASNRHRLVLLPSTSPAYAGVPYERKLAVWKDILFSV